MTGTRKGPPRKEPRPLLRCRLLGHRLVSCLAWDHSPYGDYAYETLRCERGDCDPIGYVP